MLLIIIQEHEEKKKKFPKKIIRVMSKLEVEIDKETGIISVLNDGEGIEVKKIDTEKKRIYVIELILENYLHLKILKMVRKKSYGWQKWIWC